MKKCSKCGVEYPQTKEFWHVHAVGKWRGLRPDCKICRNKQRRNRYKIMAKEYIRKNIYIRVEDAEIWEQIQAEAKSLGLGVGAYLCKKYRDENESFVEYKRYKQFDIDNVTGLLCPRRLTNDSI